MNKYNIIINYLQSFENNGELSISDFQQYLHNRLYSDVAKIEISFRPDTIQFGNIDFVIFTGNFRWHLNRSGGSSGMLLFA